ncbi:unnamed protein product [Rotaria sordida]|uniref:AIG1-type G domain-containing protein n=2 Tax=Rotaria sordida TaxID=392033 RepID=A0A819KAD7_9BILA|nr:unnamed protein product [Rotaria sordida]CAF3946242.1 unnamed protein product [Rotaria sordida]
MQGMIPEIYHKSPVNMERIAINQCGSTGSLYDGYTDNIRGQLRHNFKIHSNKIEKSMKCEFINQCMPKYQNLLKFVEIDQQLRLSLLLEMTSATGIASLINYSQMIDTRTRLLYFYQESRKETIKDYLWDIVKPVTSSECRKFATHIITEIIWGIHFLVIIQLPPDQEQEIDVVLKKLQENISNNKYMAQINRQEKALLDRIVTTTIYSNIDSLTKLKKFEYIYQTIKGLQKNSELHQRLKYILTPISWFYGRYASHLPNIILSTSEEIETLEYYLLQQTSELKTLDFRVNHNLYDLLQGKYKMQFKKIQEKLSELQVLQINDLERLKHLVLNIRNGIKSQSLNENISLDSPKEIQELNNKIIIDIEQLELKVNFIKQLQNEGCEYCDVEELGIRYGLPPLKVKDILFGNDSKKAIFYSTDEYRNNDRIRWTEIYSQLFEEKRKNPELRLVYADFTYSTYELKKMTIGMFSDMEANQNTSNSQSSENDTKIKSLSSLARSSSSTNEFINILLLGESGVGKSTFINAFANYLHFQTLGDAEKSEPIVIIPVSFLLTINDNFDEKIIKFGHIDSNENHNNSGQSVTQQCKSYVFDISNEKKLRIIDTPGFGDTRGIDQDDVNMEGIFSFLHNINYLNGICLLFKPEVVQLNLYWQSCLIQLFDYFGENIVNNFIFCFTNARSTFFTLGNTRPLLKKLFESFPRKNIPFEKNNTFCFDSEAFRYLVAIRDSIEFDPNERHDFEQSWIRSTIESERFRDFLCHLHEYRKNYEWQSIKDVQFQINFMIRPILETMRNLHRNIILYNLNLSIELSATYEISSSMICYTCNRNPEKFNDFWILPDHLHNSLNMVSLNYFLFI